MDWLLTIGFGTYCSILLALLSLIRSRTYQHPTMDSAAHFMLGGRSVNYFVTALSAHASDMSDWLFMAYPAAIYLHGTGQIWIAVGLIIGMFISWHIIAPRLRRMTEQYDTLTLSSFFEKRFHDTTGSIRIITAIMTVFFFIIYIAAGLKGVGFLLESAFNFNYYVSVVLAISLVAVYTFLGGYVGIAWLDCFQALFLLAVLVIVPCIAYLSIAGGINSIIHDAAERHIPLHIIPQSTREFLNGLLIVATWLPGYLGMPHILTKFMGISNPAELYKSKYIGIAWQIIVLTAATYVGIIGISFFATPLHNPELIFVSMVQQLFPSLLAGFMLCAILAATLSTVDAQLLVIATILTQDIYARIRTKQVTSHHLMYVSRASIIVVSLLSCGIALHKTSTIQSLVEYCWTGLACSFSPLVVITLYGRRIAARNAIATIITGGIVGIGWMLINPLIITSTGFSVPSTIPGFVLGVAIAYLL